MQNCTLDASSLFRLIKVPRTEELVSPSAGESLIQSSSFSDTISLLNIIRLIHKSTRSTKAEYLRHFDCLPLLKCISKIQALQTR